MASDPTDLCSLSDVKAWLGIGDGELRVINVTNQGSGYTSAPMVAIAGQGSGAAATAVLAGDKVDRVEITAPGRGYISGSTTVSFSLGGGSGAAASAVAAEIKSDGDAALQRLITAASALVASFCGRKLKSTSYTEYRNGQGGSSILLKNWPVTQLTSLEIDGKAIPARTTQGGSGYVLGDQRQFLYAPGYVFSPGQQNVKIAYTAGYTTNDPEYRVISQAVIELVAQKWKRRDHIDEQSHSLHGNITASFSQRDIPPETRLALKPFVQVIPVL